MLVDCEPQFRDNIEIGRVQSPQMAAILSQMVLFFWTFEPKSLEKIVNFYLSLL